MSDVAIEDHGSVVMVRPTSDAAKEWVDENVQLESWQWHGGAFACDPRMVMDLVDGMADAGLEVSDG